MEWPTDPPTKPDEMLINPFLSPDQVLFDPPMKVALTDEGDIPRTIDRDE